MCVLVYVVYVYVRERERTKSFWETRGAGGLCHFILRPRRDRARVQIRAHARTHAHELMRGSQEADVHKLPSGMLYRVLKEGKKDGKKSSPNVGDSCEVTYSGKLKDGTPFDSGTTSFAPNQVRLCSAMLF